MAKSKKSASSVQYGLPRIAVHQEIANISRLKAALETQRERINWPESLLGIPDVWTSTMGEGVKVAVLDTGVDQDHPDLKTAIIGTKDFTGDGIEDLNGHGTHCAGVIGARLNEVVLSERHQNHRSW